MLRRLFLTVLLPAAVASAAIGSVMAQQGPAQSGNDGNSAWRPSRDNPNRTASPPTPLDDESAVGRAERRSPARSGDGIAGLPSDGGQIWREYDISPYTARVTSTKRPEQAIMDWVLRETGYEAWHGEPLAVLSANRRTLRVYHTPEMQKLVADLVNRFVSSEAATYTFSLRLITLDSPKWRTSAQRLLRPVPVQTPGVNAWLLAQENAAILVGELQHRDDYREHSSPYLMVNNGQTTTVSAMRGRPYVREVIPRPNTAAGFEATPGQVDEGFNLDFSPLLSADRRIIDATIRCEIDQVEKMIPVMIDVPTADSPRQRTKSETPQMTHYRFHERFRWPVEQVLLVGLGMVALPIPVDGKPLLPGLPLPFGNTPARADLLILVECKGPLPAAVDNTPYLRSRQSKATNYRGRY